MPGSQPDPTDPTRDRAFKIRDLISHTKELSSKYHECGENIVIYECVEPFRGLLGIKQYYKDTPVKCGVKLWMLSDSISGYSHNFDIYSGRDSDFDNLDSAVLCLLL